MDLYPAGTFNKMITKKAAKNNSKSTLANAETRKLSLILFNKLNMERLMILLIIIAKTIEN